MLSNINIYNEDFISTTSVVNNSVDLIITSPPYNIGIEYDNYKDDSNYNDYLVFTKLWLNKALELSKADGRLCLNIPLDKSKGSRESVYADIVTIAKQSGWKYKSTIIWNEQSIPKRTAWGSYLSPSAPHIMQPVEAIVVLYKDQWKKDGNDKTSDITKEEFIPWTNGVWVFNGESKKKIGHPAPFPIELPRRCIKMFSYIEDTILDPFLGSGTTLLACLETNRKGIGVEMSKNYCNIAKQRIVSYHKINSQTRVLL